MKSKASAQIFRITLFIITFTTLGLAFTPPLKAEPAVSSRNEEIVKLTTFDNWLITGSIFYPQDFDANNGISKKYPAALLIHIWNGNRYEWLPLIKKLQARGFVVLAIDLRGHGDSKAKRKELFEGELVRYMYRDVEAGFDFLCGKDFIDKNNISVAGSSIGSTLAIQLCSKINNSDKSIKVRSLTLLSPAVNYFGIYVLSDLQSTKEIPALFILETNDPAPENPQNYKSGLNLFKKYKGEKKLIVVTGIGHAVYMLQNELLVESMADWMKENSK